MDEAGKKKAKELASGLRAQGGTALCQGLVDGVNMMRNRQNPNEIASVMILTDGQANQGPTSASEINASVRKGKVLSVQVAYGGYGGGQQVIVQKAVPNAKGPLVGALPSASPGPMLKNIQGGSAGPSSVGSTPDGVNKDEETKQQHEGGVEGSDELPCTINTFGFGTGHNDKLV